LSSGTVERCAAQAIKVNDSAVQTTAEVEHGKANIMKAEQNRGQQETGMRRAGTIFIRSVIVILVLTALAKLISASGGTRALDAADPLLMLTHRQVFLSVGMIELAIAAFLIFSSRQSLKVPVIAWMAANFTIYRVGLFWIGAKLPCGCLGTLTGTLGITPQTADLWMNGVLGYLLAGSVLLLTASRFVRRSTNTIGNHGEAGKRPLRSRAILSENLRTNSCLLFSHSKPASS
jgi:hypothetical protein